MPGKRQAEWPSLWVTFLLATQEKSDSGRAAARKLLIWKAFAYADRQCSQSAIREEHRAQGALLQRRNVRATTQHHSSFAVSLQLPRDLLVHREAHAWSGCKEKPAERRASPYQQRATRLTPATRDSSAAQTPPDPATAPRR